MSEREQYEAAIKNLGRTDSYTFDKHEDGSYKFDMIHFGWKIWQASANRKGYKLVPVEPSEEMCLAAYDRYGDYVGLADDIYKAMIGVVE